jgi:OTU domain-containing protein 6
VSADELAEVHKKAKKDLQSKVTALRKTVTKGDKKKKREVDAEIEALERDFEDKCRLEIDELKKKNDQNQNEQKQPVAVVHKEDEENNEVTDEKQQRISKAKKRKEKKERDELNREQAIAAQEIENKKGPAAVELKKITDKLVKRGLQVKDVKSDGNCMYYAVADQLDRVRSVTRTWQELRGAVADYMLARPDEFQPYLTTDEGDMMSEKEYGQYCERVRSTLVWGGQLELRAVADLFAVQVEVVQGEGGELVIGDHKDGGRLVLTYHRHMFGTGEHYNSTGPLVKVQSDE